MELILAGDATYSRKKQFQANLSFEVNDDHVRDGSQVREGVDDRDVGRVFVGLNVQPDELGIAQPRSDVDVAVVQVSHALRDRRLACLKTQSSN